MADTTCNNIGDAFCTGTQPVLAYLGACLIVFSSLHDVVHPLAALALGWRRTRTLAPAGGANTVVWWLFRVLELASLAAGWLLLGWAIARALFDSGKATVIVIADPISEDAANINAALAAALVFLTSALMLAFVYWRQLRSNWPQPNPAPLAERVTNSFVGHLGWLLGWLLLWTVPFAFVGGWAWIAWTLQLARSPARRFLGICASMLAAFGFLATLVARIDTPFYASTFAQWWDALSRTVLARYLYVLGVFWVATTLSMHQLSSAEDVTDLQWALILSIMGALTVVALVVALAPRAFYRLEPFDRLYPLPRMRTTKPVYVPVAQAPPTYFGGGDSDDRDNGTPVTAAPSNASASTSSSRNTWNRTASAASGGSGGLLSH